MGFRPARDEREARDAKDWSRMDRGGCCRMQKKRDAGGGTWSREGKSNRGGGGLEQRAVPVPPDIPHESGNNGNC
ncbi:hypothetical protein HNY73_005587 [Argiope bruennichi]|uniref:Uncharacterized protein n=1 Tax=Argiope bruennichi TaxID=94029 RepID=A0A8T0FH28_ARGBR|nr:hypothetical protein HNY73_005587 [Argiope bruennichi]